MSKNPFTEAVEEAVAEHKDITDLIRPALEVAITQPLKDKLTQLGASNPDILNLTISNIALKHEKLHAKTIWAVFSTQKNRLIENLTLQLNEALDTHQVKVSDFRITNKVNHASDPQQNLDSLTINITFTKKVN